MSDVLTDCLDGVVLNRSEYSTGVAAQQTVVVNANDGISNDTRGVDRTKRSAVYENNVHIVLCFSERLYCI